MKLSLIVPMYNVESYIVECLESVFLQVHDNDIEIILINDGSTDNTMLLVNHLLENQPVNIFQKVTVISQENRGLSGARNSGLKKAKGDFIYFLDSDDYIAHDFFDIVLPVLDNGIDIIEFNAKFFYVKDNVKLFLDRKNIYKAGLHTINSEEMRAEFYGWQDWAVWYRVYNREIWKNKVFPEGWLYEDALTVPFIYQKAKNIYSIDSSLIYYRNNPNSIMNTKNKMSIPSIDYGIQKFSKQHQNQYIKVVGNRFVVASVGIIINNDGMYKAFFWISDNFKKLNKSDLKSIKSKKLVLINYFPFILIPYFKLKSKGFF